MSALANKKIIVGVTGSIAAYKAAVLVRLLVKAGAEVQVLMTPAATTFITPLTLATLSQRRVYAEVSSADSWNNHVEMGLWADALVLAPLTASTLAKLAQGLADNVVVATYLSARCPVFFAPAMDLDMWAHPSTRANVARLQSWGNHLIPVGSGPLASGLSGEGRLAEPEAIVSTLEIFFSQKSDLAGQQVLVTAGPTYEPIDPVRFIGNRSSGKMGLALAEAAAARGAQVTLVLGPSALQPQHPHIVVQRVETAQEMYAASLAVFPHCQLAILAAAVADYRPQEQAPQKIKKSADQFELTLVKNPDIAATLGAQKQPGQMLVGFALETNNEEDNARSKMARKNLDLIVLNSLRDAGAGFNHDTNKVTVLTPDNKRHDLELKSKNAVANEILDLITAAAAGRS